MDNVLLEHVNSVLDQTMVRDPQKRIKDCGYLRKIVGEARMLIQNGHNVLNYKIPQQCSYCGVGHYELFASQGVEISNFGLRNVGGNDLKVLNCNKCGNVQIFRMYDAEIKWLT
jgi:hypothetical protein